MGKTQELISSEESRRQLDAFRKKRRAWARIFFFILVPIIFVVIWISHPDEGLPLEVIYSLMGFMVVTGILAFITSKGANRGWQGTLVDKYVTEVRVNRGEYMEMVPKNYLVFRTDQGKKRKISVPAGLLHYFRKGDRAVKIKGFDYPEKIDRDGKRQICITCGSIFNAGEDKCSRCQSPAINPNHFI